MVAVTVLQLEELRQQGDGNPLVMPPYLPAVFKRVYELDPRPDGSILKRPLFLQLPAPAFRQLAV